VNAVAMIGWTALASLLVMAFVLGAAPVFAAKLITLLYPKGDVRRAELVAEMCHVVDSQGVVRQWRWLGQMFAIGVLEGVPSRRAERRLRKTRTLRVKTPMRAPSGVDVDGVLINGVRLGDVNGEDLVRVDIDGETYWDSKDGSIRIHFPRDDRPLQGPTGA